MSGNLFSYCNFFESTVNGEPMNDGTVPKVWGQLNISFPAGWSENQAIEYRRRHGMLRPRHPSEDQPQ